MDMDSDSGNEWPNPMRLKTLASNVEYAEGNNLLHQFVLDNSPPHKSHSESYLNAHLRTISSSSLNVNALNEEGYSPLHLAVLKNNGLMVKKLLSCLASIDVNTRCNRRKDRNTALHLAANLGHLDIIQALLDKEASINLENLCGNTALFFAACSGHLAIIKLLVRKGADVNQMGGGIYVNSLTIPLYSAAQSGNLEYVVFLLSIGADLRARDICRQTVLHHAAESDNLAITEFLVRFGAAVDAEDINGWTPLRCAARSGHLGTLKFLLDRGAYLNIKSKRGRELFLSAIESGNLETVEFLMDKGADLNTGYENEFTPLKQAIISGNLAVVEILVRKGANVNARDNSYLTPLYYPERENLDILQFLLINGGGGDINVKNEIGRTPLHNALVIGKLEIVKFLLDNGADFNAVDETGQHLLHHAVSFGCLGSVELLIDKGADVNAKDKDGLTPLHTAVIEESSLEVTKMLIERGADVNATDEVGKAPLHHLLKSPGYNCYVDQCRNRLKIKLLLDGNADVTIKDKNEETPLGLAMRSQCSELIELFSERATEPKSIKD